MSNGGEESNARECLVTQNSENKLGRIYMAEVCDDMGFALAIGRIAVAEVCDDMGFQGFHQSALNTFSDVAVRYITQIGKAANLYANLSGRRVSNAFDIIQGFSGASNKGQCLAASGIVEEIAEFVNDMNDDFPYLIPSFPVAREQERVASLHKSEDSPPGERIPTWLPAFPDSHEYFQERDVDKRMDKIEPLKQKGEVEKSMVNLQQHMSCNGFEAPIAVDTRDAKREVAVVVIPTNLLNGDVIREHENDVMLFEPFSPVARPMKSPLKDSEEMKEKVILNTRPTVQSKLMFFKKSSGTTLSLKIDEVEQMNSMFGDNNNKHERKTIAEQIL